MAKRKLIDYEQAFLRFYSEKYNVKYIKVRNNHKLIATEVILYNENKRLIKKQPVPNDVTLINMFDRLDENKLYEVSEIIGKE